MLFGLDLVKIFIPIFLEQNHFKLTGYSSMNINNCCFTLYQECVIFFISHIILLCSIINNNSDTYPVGTVEVYIPVEIYFKTLVFLSVLPFLLKVITQSSGDNNAYTTRCFSLWTDLGKIGYLYAQKAT